MLHKFMNAWHVYTGCISPTLNGNSALQHFKRGNVIEIHVQFLPRTVQLLLSHISHTSYFSGQMLWSNHSLCSSWNLTLKLPTVFCTVSSYMGNSTKPIIFGSEHWHGYEYIDTQICTYRNVHVIIAKTFASQQLKKRVLQLLPKLFSKLKLVTDNLIHLSGSQLRSRWWSTVTNRQVCIYTVYQLSLSVYILCTCICTHIPGLRRVCCWSWEVNGVVDFFLCTVGIRRDSYLLYT